MKLLIGVEKIADMPVFKSTINRKKDKILIVNR